MDNPKIAHAQNLANLPIRITPFISAVLAMTKTPKLTTPLPIKGTLTVNQMVLAKSKVFLVENLMS